MSMNMNGKETMNQNHASNQLEKIAILDFGSKTTQDMTRKVRELGVYSEQLSYKTTAEELQNKNVKGIIFSGSPKNVYAEDAYRVDPAIYELGLPILGICYGHQLIATDFGGKVVASNGTNLGKDSLTVIDQSSALLSSLPTESDAFMAHGDYVDELPEGFSRIATTENVNVAGMEHHEKKIYGIQFHPEQEETKEGDLVLKNFLFDICQLSGNWSPATFIENEIASIKAQVGNKKVILGLSGGVDSSVAGVLLQRAIGDQLTCIFVDHGLLRKDESKQVMDSLSGKFGLNVILVDAKERFLDKLKGQTDPEIKRKIIGNEFIEVFKEEADKLEGIEFLAQGTIYSDVIESGTDSSGAVKSHHNVGGLPKDLQFKLIEPLRTLFKDEVRAVGEELSIPKALVWRQPFPGPGLGVRVLGEITEAKLHIVRESDAILRDEIEKAGLTQDIWQYFTALPDIQSVGVRDGVRTYDHMVGIRAVRSNDAMEAEWARIPYDVLEKISTRITDEVDHVNRVVYDITSKPPATIEWE